jgi:hypothetical protein
MRVALGAAHHYASRTEHRWVDSTGSYAFEPFFKLEIKQEAGKSWCHLFRYTTDNRIHGKIAETFCDTVEDAICQAEWEFGVRAEEWQTVAAETAPECPSDSDDYKYKN